VKAIVIIPGKNGRGFDLFDYLVNELNAHGIEARVIESETDAEKIKAPRVGVYNALPGPFAKGGK
jgi:hypothetical protein